MKEGKSCMQIRRIKIDDLKERVKWMNHPKVYSTMHFSVPVIIENTINWYNKNKDNKSRSDVVFTENGNIIAFGGLTSIDEATGMAELYIFVNPYSQNRGFGTIATSMLCEWGFNKLGLRKIYLYTNEENEPAIKVYQKCGFVLEGRHRKEYINEKGELKDRLYMGLMKNELNAQDTP